MGCGIGSGISSLATSLQTALAGERFCWFFRVERDRDPRRGRDFFAASVVSFSNLVKA